LSRKKFRHDVDYYLPNRKRNSRAIAHSTLATNDFIEILAEDGSTFKQCRDKIGTQFLRDPEAENVLDAYIAKGFGNYVVRNYFRWD